LEFPGVLLFEELHAEPMPIASVESIKHVKMSRSAILSSGGALP